MAILNSSGVAVVEYTYDAWGKPLTTTGSMASGLGLVNPLRYRGYVYDQETGLYYLQSRYYNPAWGRFISADGQLNMQDGVLGFNLFAYCINNPVNMSDPTGHWAEWLETAVKIASVVIAVAAVVVMVATVSAASAGTAAPGAVYGASIFLGAALSGINGGVANEAKGNSYFNGYLGGAAGGAIQSWLGKKPMGTIVGGGLGVAVGTTITELMNLWDPYSANSSFDQIKNNVISSTKKALVTSSLTVFMGYSSDVALMDNTIKELMPTFTYGFSEGLKAFYGWLDDAVVYIWE